MIILLPLSVVYGVGIYRVIKGEGTESIEVLLATDAVLTLALGLVSILSPGFAFSTALVAALSSVYFPKTAISGGK